ncbi:hypothetical protein BJX68DRAFT_251316 [Aspergillus pseudodeflectus]|uniref:Uncharacterized protein n=1 Tax=Aspergillus pseudodeflectus TaxID=176178 RepID=A0ABR4J7Q7_9EURO
MSFVTSSFSSKVSGLSNNILSTSRPSSGMTLYSACFLVILSIISRDNFPRVKIFYSCLSWTHLV